MRILVVEDEPDMNRLIIKTLKKEGYSADGCQNGEDALVYLAGAEYDTILLDVMMPKLDGFSLLQKIRHQGMDVPVLMLTARDAVSDRVKGLDYGADDYLVKPFDFDELTARIRAMTRRQPQQPAVHCRPDHRYPEENSQPRRRGNPAAAKRIFHTGIHDTQPRCRAVKGTAGKSNLEL